MKEELYFNKFLVNDHDTIRTEFYKSLILTNRTFDFYVDWDKVEKYFKKYKIELNILNALINESNFDEVLREILEKYPNVLPVIPLLIALRNTRFPIVSSFSSEKIENYIFDFTDRKLTPQEIEDIMTFFQESGLKDFFLNLSQKSIPDYYIGVEVGMDTHARKNRSGKIMEDVVNSHLIEINNKTGNRMAIFSQKKYSFLNKKYGYNIGSGLANRKADFLLVNEKQKVIAIETNYYRKTGSKPQEIVNSYIQRQNELKRCDINFIWITDGLGWKKQKNQMNFAFERLDYILNLSFIKRGILEDIILSIFY